MADEPDRVSPDGAGGTAEERLEELLQSVPREGAPEALWLGVARSLAPEAVAGRRLARRRQVALRAVLAAASVLLVVGVWTLFLTEHSGPQDLPTAVVPAPSPVESGLAALAESDLDTLGEVHLAYDAGNVLPEDMVLAVSWGGDEVW